MNKLNTEIFVDRAIKIHGEKYIYSKVDYKHSLEKITIVCKKHGDFYIKPSNHINNKQGCPLCGNESTANLQKKSLHEFLTEISKKSGFENYDFSMADEFKNIRDEIRVVCKTHGLYCRSPRDIRRSKFFGCKKCKIECDTFTNKEFIEKSKLNHKNYYNYKKTNYVNAHSEVTVTCPKHGDFDVMPYIHIKGKGFCPKCTNFVSSYEIEIGDFLKNNGIDITTSVRNIKDIKEIDLICESKKIAIEFNGLYWHCDLFKNKNYHLNKKNIINQKGYRLINIFEDEWVEKKDICKSMLLNSFGKSKQKIYARNCIVKEISFNDSKCFLIENHIQGNCTSKYRFGLYYKEDLVAVMTFGKNRICLNNKIKNYEYELLRFCSKKFTNVLGGASKLLNYFIKNIKPKKITSYCDNRWGTGIVYSKLGFNKVKDTGPNYFYTKGNARYNRFSFRKDVLVKKGKDKNKTEKQIMKDDGYNRVYDCGSSKFELIINYS